MLDGCAEFALVRAHREVDGIEVGFAVEATSEIGATIHGGLGLVAVWADEHELSGSYLVGPAEMPDQPINGNVVA